MQVTGKVKRVEETKTAGANDFKSREIVIVTEEQYPQTIAVQFTQGNVTMLDNYKEGETLKIDVNLEGRDWTNAEGKITCFNTIKGWKIEKVA